jgi:hypothetical protein
MHANAQNSIAAWNRRAVPQDGSAVEVADVNVVNALRYYIEHEADFTPRDRIAIAHRAIAALTQRDQAVRAVPAAEVERLNKLISDAQPYRKKMEAEIERIQKAWHEQATADAKEIIRLTNALREMTDSEMPNCCLGLSRKDCEHCIL